jgi:hypothetical protein
MEKQHHRPGVPECFTLAPSALDRFRAQLQRGEALTIIEQRALVAEVDRLARLGTDNLNRLVDAREKFDAIAKMEADGSRLSAGMLLALLGLGKALGVSPKG